MSEQTSSKPSQIAPGPIPLGWELVRAPEQAWPWLAEQRASKIRPFIENAQRILDFSADAGWNILNLDCPGKLSCPPLLFPEFPTSPSGGGHLRSLDEVQPSSIDFIVCHHSLGLVMDPQQVLMQLRSKLRPGGRLLLFVPGETERTMRRLLAERSSRWFFTWTVQTLGNLLGEAGFEYLQGRVDRIGSEVFALGKLPTSRPTRTSYRFWKGVAWWFSPFLEISVLARLCAEQEFAPSPPSPLSFSPETGKSKNGFHSPSLAPTFIHC